MGSVEAACAALSYRRGTMQQPLHAMVSARSGIDRLNEWPVPDDSPIAEYVDKAGFGVFRKLDNFKLDNSLLAALIHYFDPVTHTFFINGNHYMISLEDISFLTGLPIDGEPVCVKEAPESICVDLLGGCEIVPHRKNISFEHLRLTFSQVGQNEGSVRVEQCARAYLLYVIGLFVVSGQISDSVPYVYLECLRDLSAVHTLSWGGALLAGLLNSLAHSKSSTKAPHIACAPILLFWAFEHFPILRPPMQILEEERRFPLLKYWTHNYSTISAKAHKKKLSHDWKYVLDGLEVHMVNVSPYNEVVIEEELPLVRQHCLLRSSVTAVVCISTFVLLRPDICSIQFPHLGQTIVPTINKPKGRRGPIPANHDWPKIMEEPIECWRQRWNIIEQDAVESPIVGRDAHENAESPNTHSPSELAIGSQEHTPYSQPSPAGATTSASQPNPSPTYSPTAPAPAPRPPSPGGADAPASQPLPNRKRNRKRNPAQHLPIGNGSYGGRSDGGYGGGRSDGGYGRSDEGRGDSGLAVSSGSWHERLAGGRDSDRGYNTTRERSRSPKAGQQGWGYNGGRNRSRSPDKSGPSSHSFHDSVIRQPRLSFADEIAKEGGI